MSRLRASWSKREKDIVFHYPSKPDGHLLHDFFSYAKLAGAGKSLLEELEARGYDLATLKFSIERKTPSDSGKVE